jgi:hypothetical protein
MHQIGSVIRTFVIKPTKSPVPMPRPAGPEAQTQPVTTQTPK